MDALDELVAELSLLSETSVGIKTSDQDRLHDLLRAAIREEVRDELGIDEAPGP